MCLALAEEVHKLAQRCAEKDHCDDDGLLPTSHVGTFQQSLIVLDDGWFMMVGQDWFIIIGEYWSMMVC